MNGGGYSQKAIESAVVDVHRSIAVLKNFVVSRALTHGDSGDRYSAVFDAMMLYVRSLVSAAAHGVLRISQPMPSSSNAALPALHPPASGSSPLQNSLDASGALVQVLCHQLSCELEERNFVMGEGARLAESLEGLKSDTTVVELMRHRIEELQQQSTTTAAGAPSVAAFADRQGKNDGPAARELGRLALAQRDKLERSRADAMRLQGETAALAAENAILVSRVAQLEEQLGAVSSAASTTLRELNRQRVSSASKAASSQNSNVGSAKESTQARRSATPVSRPVNASGGNMDVVIDGLVIERPIALWLKDMYMSLQKSGDLPHVNPRKGNNSIPFSALLRHQGMLDPATSFAAHVAETRNSTALNNSI